MGLKWGTRLSQAFMILTFSVALPTFDAGGDIYLSIIATLGSHVRWGLALFLPVLLNLCFTTKRWWDMDTREEKKWSWILVVTMVWPQVKAMKLFWTIVVKGKESGLVQKKEFDRRVKGLEPWTEAIPQVIF